LNTRTRRRFKKALAAAALVSLGALASTAAFSATAPNPGLWNTTDVNPAVPTPQSLLGFTPGDDYKLDSWADVVKYYEALAATSDRVVVEKAGKTTLGNDYLIVYISSPENLANLEKYQQLNLEITDPRKIPGGDKEAKKLISEAKIVVALTYGIHSTETASYLGGQRVAYRLAAQNDPETLKILDNDIIVLVPARNPDGVDIVKDGYDAQLAEEAADPDGDDPITPSDSVLPPGSRAGLINKYIGHDDNRDFVGATQPETQIEEAKVYNAWHPEIVHDVHQQGANGPRLTLPPFTQPSEPNIPPSIRDGYTKLGHEIAWDLHLEGYKGVQTGGSAGGEGYDDWSPLRHYVHFHNAIRILEESASVNLASPIVSQPYPRPGETNPNVLDPFPGGKWTIGDGVSLVQATTYSLLDHAATDRVAYLTTAYENAKYAVRDRQPGELAAYLIPDTTNREVLLSTLYKGGVEIRFLTKSYTVGDTTYQPGTAVVELNQIYGGYANALLSDQHYPNLFDKNGNPIHPYDVTAHTVSLLYNVPAIPVVAPFDAQVTSPEVITQTPAKVAKDWALPAGYRLGLLKSSSQDQGWVRFAFDLNTVNYTEFTNADIAAGNLNAKYDALIFESGIGGGGRFGRGGGRRGGAPGTPGAPGAAGTSGAADSQGPGATAAPAADPSASAATPQQTPVASAAPAPNAAIGAPTAPGAAPVAGGYGGGGGFGGRGVRGGTVSAAGIANLKTFVTNGGTIIAIDGAANSFITAFNLPLKDVTQGLTGAAFFSPGEILNTDVDTSSPLAKGFADHSIVWAQNSPAWEITDPTQAASIDVVLKYDENSDPLLSGWLLGGDTLKGKAALVDVKYGQGHIILFGFVPLYRGLSLATYPFVWNAIAQAVPTPTVTASNN